LVIRYKFLILETYHTDTLYLRKQGRGFRWVFFQAKRGSASKNVGETLVSIIFQLQRVSALAFLHASSCDCWYFMVTVLRRPKHVALSCKVDY